MVVGGEKTKHYITSSNMVSVRGGCLAAADLLTMTEVSPTPAQLDVSEQRTF